MTAPEKIYICDPERGPGFYYTYALKAEDAAAVQYIRADIHQAEVDALHAECDRLTAMVAPYKKKWMTKSAAQAPGFSQGEVQGSRDNQGRSKRPVYTERIKRAVYVQVRGYLHIHAE